MKLTLNTVNINHLDDAITLYRSVIHTQNIRSKKERRLEVIGHFKAAIDEAQFSKPDPLIAQIHHIKKIFIRASNHFRHEFNKENYIGHQEQILRIASVRYNRLTGMSCCICYDIDPQSEHLHLT